MMQRRVWQHNAEFAALRSHPGHFDFRGGQENGPGHRKKQSLALRSNLNQDANCIQISGHNRERFFFAVFALA